MLRIYPVLKLFTYSALFCAAINSSAQPGASTVTSSVAQDCDSFVTLANHSPLKAQFDILIFGNSKDRRQKVASDWKWDIDDLGNYRQQMIPRLRVLAGLESTSNAHTPTLKANDPWLKLLVNAAAHSIPKPYRVEDRNEFASYIVWNRIFTNSPETLVEIGRKFGISGERVRQNEFLLARYMNAYVSRHIHLVEKYESIDDKIAAYSSADLITALLPTALHVPWYGRRPFQTGAFESWLWTRVARELEPNPPEVSSENYLKNKRFFDLVLALQLGVDDARKECPESERSLLNKIVNERIFTAQEFPTSLHKVAFEFKLSTEQVIEFERWAIRTIVEKSQARMKVFEDGRF